MCEKFGRGPDEVVPHASTRERLFCKPLGQIWLLKAFLLILHDQLCVTVPRRVGLVVKTQWWCKLYVLFLSVFKGLSTEVFSFLHNPSHFCRMLTRFALDCSLQSDFACRATWVETGAEIILRRVRQSQTFEARERGFNLLTLLQCQ